MFDLLIKIGDVAKQLNIPASTIRYYEKIGLLKNQSRISGCRHFNQDSMMRLQFIKLAQTVGFTIAEIKVLLEHFSSEPKQQQQLRQQFIQDKQQEIKQKIKDLQAMDKALTQANGCLCTSLETCIPKVIKKSVQTNGIEVE